MPKTRPSAETERVWLLAGAALAALFLLRTAGMIFQGAITGFGMYVGLYVLFSWFPTLKRILFGLGGVFDIIVSFGMPWVISQQLGITGGTMLIATLTCGLLFTFTMVTKRLGGPVRAGSSSAKVIFRDLASNFEAWKEEFNGRRSEMGGSGRGSSPGGGSDDQCEEAEEAPPQGRGRSRPAPREREGGLAPWDL